ncbi:hypothetical protein A2988_01030 [Candidatus Azambacteria bacterium RIFCSPLOWO2_01_FULL_46_25]|uniref:Fibronectin type-III domain-containing protein n=1 Tax=Candidatus Azambacteria bacterium RIFCSPLOWO2_01_FULL_46_25 TaxID=1797298 RepID=A0A1F5BTV0_9BACT|nr:MAG: hypothetical protein A2988_01030 [Candidatus Azambacteria bacterium RIFCSPLOWO2_01_FULL_46_25]
MKKILFSAAITLGFSFFISPVSFAASVNVVSPNGGQCYTPGSTVSITWSGTDYDHVALAYRMESEGSPPMYSSNPSVWNIMHPASGSTYDWATPSGISTGVPYKIWIEAHSPSHGYLAVDSSDWSFGFATSCSSGSGSGSGSGTSGDTQAPTAPVASISVQSSSSISISWSGSTDNVGVTGYTIYRNGTYLTTTTGLSYSDSGLAAGTLFSYTVAAYDAAGNMSSQSSAVSATTLTSSGSGSTTTTTTTDTTAPVISTVQAVNIMGSGAQITWMTDDASDSRVMYSATSGNFSFSSDYRCDAGGNVTAHCVNLTGLSYGMIYYFKVESKNSGYLNTASTQYQFTAASSGTTSGTTTTTSGTSGTTSTTTQDFTAPTSPTTASAYAVSSSSISISWSGATDNIGVAGYKIFRSGSHLTTTTALSYTDAGLNPSTNYVYAIAAYDATGNISAWSPSASATTMSAATTAASDAVLSGKVTDAQGVGLAGIFVSANQYTTGAFAQTKSGSDGRFALAVAPGDWGVSVYSEPLLGYYYEQGQKTVTVSSGQTNVVNFTMLVADAQIFGSVVDQNGQVLADAFGYISTYAFATTGAGSGTMTMTTPAFGGPIEKGNFSFRVPAGTYTLTIYFSPDSKYSAPSSQSVTVAAGAVQKASFTIAGDDATIAGSLRDAGGAAVTGIDASTIKIYVSSVGGAWRNAIMGTGGMYSVRVGPGTWYLGAWVDPSSGYVAQGSDIAVAVVAGEKRTIDVILTKADSFIAGTTKAADGSPLANAWISIENRSFTDMSVTTMTSMLTSPFVAGGNSDNLGNFKIAVPPGTYFAHAFFGPEQGFINPAEVSVTVAAGKTATIDLLFRKPDTKLTGATTIDGKGVPAFVWAWSESGGSASTRSDANGAYSLNVTRRDRWHVASSFEQNGAFSKSSDAVIEIDDQASAVQDLVLLSVAALAQAAERVVEVAKPQSVEVSDGAKVTMPANALGTTGSASITMKPTTEVPSFSSSSVVGTGYQIDAKNDVGTSITNLNSEITITIPYDDADLAAKGLTPESLALSFLDETANVWKPLDKQIIDKQNKTISAGVNHLTLFALVAPADTAPPVAPTAVAATAAANAITLAWKNPSADFHHVKIYRSLQAGTLGEVAFNYVTSETKTDSSGTAAHYYVVRSVDLAGNESANTVQVKSGAAGATQATAALAATPSGVLLVRVAGDPRVYVVKDGKRQWIRSPEEFAQGGYDWKAIVAISAAQLAAYPEGSVSAAKFVFTQNLSLGARSEAVRKLQELLSKDKEVYPRGIVSGYFGSLTKAAVVQFQKKYGIVPANGFVGPETRPKLNELQG